MNIVVCIKQVPDSDKVTIDRETNRLNRAGVPSIINPFDENALEMALQLKDIEMINALRIFVSAIFTTYFLITTRTEGLVTGTGENNNSHTGIVMSMMKGFNQFRNSFRS